MAQKLQVNHESRLFDFVYDPTYALSARDFVKAENYARHHFLSARRSKTGTSDLDGILSVRPLFTTTEHNDFHATNNNQSIVVHGRQSPRYISSINRYKFYSTPLSSADYHKPLSLPKPVLYTPIQTPSFVDERRTSMKTDLESTVVSSSSGYNSMKSGYQPMPTSAKVQAIIERLYHGHQPGRQCSRCSSHHGHLNSEDDPSSQSPSLPRVNAKDIELVESMRAKRRLGRQSSRSNSSESTGNNNNINNNHSNRSHVKSTAASTDCLPLATTGNTNAERTPASSSPFVGKRNRQASPRLESPNRKLNSDDYVRLQMAAHTDNLKKDIEEKLKRLKLRHERDLQRLERQYRSRSRDRRPDATVDTIESKSDAFFRKSEKTKRREKVSTKREDDSKRTTITTPSPVDKLSPSNGTPVSDKINEIATLNIEEYDEATKDTVEIIDLEDEAFVDEHQQTFETEAEQKEPESNYDAVDAKFVQDQIIKPLVDFIIADSIITVANYRTNEDIAHKLTGRTSLSVLKDVNEFLSKNLLPSSINIVYQALNTPDR